MLKSPRLWLTEVASNFNLGVDKDGIEKLIEVVPEGMTNEELRKLEQDHKAEEHTRKETTGENKNYTLRKLAVKVLLYLSQTSADFLKFENMHSNVERFPLLERCSWLIICFQANLQ